MLEGMEYLKLHRGFTPLLRLVAKLQEMAEARRGRFLLAVGEGALDGREVALLKGEGRFRELPEPPGRPAPRTAEVAPGRGYLYLDRNPERAYRALRSWVSQGRTALAVARSSPEEVRRRYGLGPETQVLWLTTSKGPGRVDPSDLELLLKIIRDFLEEGEDRAVLLEGLDHLSAVVGFSAVQKLISHLVDACVSRRAAALVPLDPFALEKGKMAFLSRELAVVEPGS